MTTKKNGTTEKAEIASLKKVVDDQGKTINNLRERVGKLTMDFGELAKDFLEISSTLDNLSLKARRTVFRYEIESEATISRGIHKENFLEELIGNIASVKQEMESMGHEKA